MLDHKFLADVVEVPLAHLLEAVSDILLYQFGFFVCHGGGRAIDCGTIRVLGIRLLGRLF